MPQPLWATCDSAVILTAKKGFLCFSFCPLPPVLSLGITEQSPAPTASHPPCRYLLTLMRSPLSLLLQAEESQLSQPLLTGEMLQSMNQLCGPLLDSLQYVYVLRNPELDSVIQVWLHQC